MSTNSEWLKQGWLVTFTSFSKVNLNTEGEGCLLWALKWLTLQRMSCLIGRCTTKTDAKDFRRHLVGMEPHVFSVCNVNLHGVTCRKSIKDMGGLHSLRSPLTPQGHGFFRAKRIVCFMCYEYCVKIWAVCEPKDSENAKKQLWNEVCKADLSSLVTWVCITYIAKDRFLYIDFLAGIFCWNCSEDWLSRTLARQHRNDKIFVETRCGIHFISKKVLKLLILKYVFSGYFNVVTTVLTYKCFFVLPTGPWGVAFL